jgi:hypothetical protein
MEKKETFALLRYLTLYEYHYGHSASLEGPNLKGQLHENFQSLFFHDSTPSGTSVGVSYPNFFRIRF